MVSYAIEEHGEGSPRLALLVWRFFEPHLAVSSAPLGGGIGVRSWVINVQVPHSYARRDPESHLGELARGCALHGPGVGMLTAVDVRSVRSADDGGAHVDASVGTTIPTWAAAPHDAATLDDAGASDDAGVRNDGAVLDTDRPAARVRPGTINIVGFVPERLSAAALVNAVVSVTEAKSQALWEAGISATGTASDAVCIVCRQDGPEHRFGGPRSLWGARLARAAHRAVLAGCVKGST
jgi:adenosylcobinamide hydrolase